MCVVLAIYHNNGAPEVLIIILAHDGGQVQRRNECVATGRGCSCGAPSPCHGPWEAAQNASRKQKVAKRTSYPSDEEVAAIINNHRRALRELVVAPHGREESPSALLDAAKKQTAFNEYLEFLRDKYEPSNKNSGSWERQQQAMRAWSMSLMSCDQSGAAATACQVERYPICSNNPVPPPRRPRPSYRASSPANFVTMSVSF
mmetsp:Transcript_25931/g.56266  ORF Transcript_25931/g.56266 Transcript_25931/m.56266 type:complete len:202 (-) Transcript_25931:252-857(-)